MVKKIFLLFAIAISSYCSNGQTLVASWEFNGNGNDVSGNGLNATVYNVTSTNGRDGVPNTAYQFNGINSHIDVPYSPLLNLSNWTIQTIIRIDGFNQNTCQAEFIVSRSAQSTTDWMMVGINDNAHDNSCTTFSPNNTEFIPAAAGSASSSWHDANYIQLGIWYCHTVTYDGLTLKTYVNGALVDSEIWSNQYDFSNTAISQPSLIFGYYPPGGTTFPYWLNGAIDKLSIWNGILSNAAITNNCLSESAETNVANANPTDNEDNIKLYPNPNNGSFTLDGNSTSNTIKIQIVNEIGCKMYERLCDCKGNRFNQKVSVNGLAAGVYYMRLVGAKTKVIKFSID